MNRPRNPRESYTSYRRALKKAARFLKLYFHGRLPGQVFWDSRRLGTYRRGMKP